MPRRLGLIVVAALALIGLSLLLLSSYHPVGSQARHRARHGGRPPSSMSSRIRRLQHQQDSQQDSHAPLSQTQVTVLPFGERSPSNAARERGPIHTQRRTTHAPAGGRVPAGGEDRTPCRPRPRAFAGRGARPSTRGGALPLGLGEPNQRRMTRGPRGIRRSGGWARRSRITLAATLKMSREGSRRNRCLPISLSAGSTGPCPPSCTPTAASTAPSPSARHGAASLDHARRAMFGKNTRRVPRDALRRRDPEGNAAASDEIAAPSGLVLAQAWWLADWAWRPRPALQC